MNNDNQPPLNSLTIREWVERVNPTTKTPMQIAADARAEAVARAAAEIAEAEAEEDRREATAPTRGQMEQAVEVLQGSERGRATLQGVLTLLDESALGLDHRGQNAVMTLLRSAWGPFAGSTRDCMRDALDGLDGVGENSAPLPDPQARSAGKRAR